MNSLAVILVTYYTGDILFSSIEAILKEDINELIIIDNGNPDTVSNRMCSLKEKDKRIRLYSENNIGFSKACNLAVKNSFSDILLFLNPDVVSEKEAIKKLKNTYKKVVLDKETNKILMSGLVLEEGEEARGLRRNLLTLKSLFIEILSLYKVFPFLKSNSFNIRSKLPSADIFRIPVLSGSCMIISSSFFKDLNGFDEGYFLHVEDVDFCRRVISFGGESFIYKKAIFNHKRSSSDVPSYIINKYKRDSFIYYFKTYNPLFCKTPFGYLFFLLIDIKYKYMSPLKGKKKIKK